jgi:hypothetical protein
MGNPPQLSSIPTAGPSGFFASVITGIRFFNHAQEIIQDGYNKVSYSTRGILYLDKPSIGDRFLKFP